MRNKMIVIGWHNGSPDDITGAGYGLKIQKEDRDKFFQKNWKSINIIINSKQSVNVKISKSFWKESIELRSSAIGKWMIDNKFAPWSKGNPSKFNMLLIGNKQFQLQI